MKIGRRATLALAASALAAGDAIAQAPRGGEPRIGMTLNDIPATCGAPDQGGEGIRWMGFTIYDSSSTGTQARRRRSRASSRRWRRASRPNGKPGGSGLFEPALQSLLDQAEREFDETKRDALLARGHEIVVDNAYWLWVVHDVNPRALRPQVQGSAKAKSWYQALRQVTVRR
ncbi:MAG: transporter substrate-binding protein [Rhodospirillales bacterium]|nr:transporter substrate-binding protein [Rhodospirillales bacterium]